MTTLHEQSPVGRIGAAAYCRGSVAGGRHRCGGRRRVVGPAPAPARGTTTFPRVEHGSRKRGRRRQARGLPRSPPSKWQAAATSALTSVRRSVAVRARQSTTCSARSAPPPVRHPGHRDDRKLLDPRPDAGLRRGAGTGSVSLCGSGNMVVDGVDPWSFSASLPGGGIWWPAGPGTWKPACRVPGR